MNEEATMVTERIPRKVEDLRHQLAVFVKLATSLRQRKVEERNLSQIAAVEHEIDELRKALSYPPLIPKR